MISLWHLCPVIAFSPFNKYIELYLFRSKGAMEQIPLFCLESESLWCVEDNCSLRTGYNKKTKVGCTGSPALSLFFKTPLLRTFCLKFLVCLFPLEINWKPTPQHFPSFMFRIHFSMSSQVKSFHFQLLSLWYGCWVEDPGHFILQWSKGNLVWGYFSSFLSFRFVVAYQDTWHCTFQWSSRQLQMLLQRWGWRSAPRALLVEVFVQFSRLAPRHS